MFTKPTASSTSSKQVAANKANAARSTGPRTPQGKSASSQNATSHGLCSVSVAVHYWESQEDYDRMRAEYIGRFQPVDRPELDLIDRLVDCTWRRNRAVSMETTLLNLNIEEMDEEIRDTYQETEDGLLRVSLAFFKRHREGVWDSLTRHITAAERGYQRAMRELRQLQEAQRDRPCDTLQTQERSTPIPFCASDSEAQRDRPYDPPQTQERSTPIPFCASDSEAQRDRPCDTPQTQEHSMPIPFCASDPEAQRDRPCETPQTQEHSMPIRASNREITKQTHLPAETPLPAPTRIRIQPKADFPPGQGQHASLQIPSPDASKHPDGEKHKEPRLPNAA